MATKIVKDIGGCTFQWKIENISHCWLKQGERIDSPRFIADALEGTKWFLRMYMYPSESTAKKYISFYLRREDNCIGPESIEINFHIAILDKDGSILREKPATKSNYKKPDTHGYTQYTERETVFVTEREKFLPKDTLTVLCTMWQTEVKTVDTQHLYAQTVYRVERRNFIWIIDKLSTLKCGLKNKFKGTLVEFGIFLREGLDIKKKLVINIDSFHESIKYFSFKTSIVDSDGRKENCGTHEYFAADLKRGTLCTLLCTEKLMENRNRYLPNDVLSLDGEYVCSNGAVLYENCSYGMISSKVTNEVVASVNENNNGKEKSQIISVMANDLKSMYDDQIFCDIELRTSTQTFPAHKNILSARSPVFRKMYSNDMKEKNSGHVDITDLEDDTLHQMLLYIYTDKLDDMQFDSACKLYVAADKYEILTLRSCCGTFLKDNLCSAKACDVLVLADQHQDDHLKNAVQDFILKHDKEVFGAQEWKDFMGANSKLAAEMMYQFTLCKINGP